MAHDCSVLIVGGGVFGLSTALSLARGKYRDDPARILVIDRSATPPEQDAASSDLNKIVRNDYSDPVYAGIARDAITRWEQDPVYKPFFHQSGIVVTASALGEHGETYVRQSHKQQEDLFVNGRSPAGPQMIESDEQYSRIMNPSSSSSSSFTSRPPATSDGSGSYASDDRALPILGKRPPVGYSNSASGWAWSSGAMQAVASECRRAGVSFAVGQVNALVFEGGDVRGARTKDGTTYRAQDLVVLAAGSWSPAILPELSGKVTATGQVVATIQLEPEEAKLYSDMPVFIDMQTGFYMFPPNEDNIVKFALHHKGYTNDQPSLANADERTSVPRTGHFAGSLEEGIPRQSIVELRNELRRVRPALAEKPFAGTRLCWYCDSKDCDFLVSYHDKYPSLFLATGGSGHAFKFLPVIGDLCALVIDGKLDSQLAEAWSFTRERRDYQPDRGTSVRRALDVSELARMEDLLHVDKRSQHQAAVSA